MRIIKENIAYSKYASGKHSNIKFKLVFSFVTME